MKELLKKMTLREKIGQTAMPAPPAVKKGVKQEGGYVEYFKKYPYNGFYVSTAGTMIKDDGSELLQSCELAEIAQKTCDELDIPLFVAVDAEFGGKGVFPDMSCVPANMALGAANSPELAYKRGYYWAKELKAAGMNWAFGPVCDIMPSFFSGSTRCISDKTEHINGIIPHLIKGISDAVSMKGIAAAFDHDDMYIECFRAGNDIVLFTGNDYIDVMEKAVMDGRISEEQIDRSVERILRYKKKLGLFDGKAVGEPMTDADKADFAKVNYEISRQGATLLNNEGMIPFDREKIKKATIIAVAPSDKFHAELVNMQEAFAKYGIESEIVPTVNSKSDLKKIDENSDLIVYACYIAWTEPQGFPGYSQQREIMTLFNGLSYGAKKSVVASFGSPTVYYNYFETVDAYINMYSQNKESMQAFVDGILGEFEFAGKSPVSLYPELV